MQTELRLVSLERLRLIAVEAKRLRDVEEELGSRIERVGCLVLGGLGMITGLLEGFPLQKWPRAFCTEAWSAPAGLTGATRITTARRARPRRTGSDHITRRHRSRASLPGRT